MHEQTYAPVDFFCVVRKNVRASKKSYFNDFFMKLTLSSDFRVTQEYPISIKERHPRKVDQLFLVRDQSTSSEEFCGLNNQMICSHL